MSASLKSLLILLLLVLAACVPDQAKKPAEPPPPPEVLVAMPTEESVAEYEEYPGRLVASESVEIRSRVTGYLDQVHFQDGDLVQAGELLFEIDSRWYEAEAKQAAATLLQSETRLERMRRREERVKELVAPKAISEDEFDTARFDHTEAEAATTAARAHAELANLNLSYTKIRAKFNGRIGRRHVDPGNLIKADETALATLVNFDPIHAYFAIDERTLLKLNRMFQDGSLAHGPGHELSVRVALADEDDFSRDGVINFLDNQVDPQTGTLAARAVVPNPDGFLAPGLFVRMRTPIGPPRPALVVPEEALGSDQGQRFLYVLDDEDQATYRRVKVGRAHHGKRVVKEGLEKGDRVIVSGLQRVRHGQKVTPKSWEEGAAAGKITETPDLEQKNGTASKTAAMPK